MGKDASRSYKWVGQHRRCTEAAGLCRENADAFDRVVVSQGSPASPAVQSERPQPLPQASKPLDDYEFFRRRLVPALSVRTRGGTADGQMY